MQNFTLFHITSAAAWHDALALGQYRTPHLHSTGFIHLCRMDQLAFVIQRFFPQPAGHVLLHLDPARLSAPVLDEVSEPGMPPFPHLYGPLNLDAVVKVEPLLQAPTGSIAPASPSAAADS